ncbi:MULTISPECIES: DUF637 domain-containing protein [unclassified Acinetobacter]|uniref:DUF637 domain-containing protein n=1 Tax=unclassified Acinetobacter TaxID=196816 RepID=UPI0015D34B8C|nr:MULTISPECIES: DUF637 domain-containing protein [unclassified Acinetobacter]
MNKNLYRIIFSKPRNMFIAVGENSKSQTKAAGESAKIAISPGTHDSTALHQHWVVKSLVASMSIWMSVAPVYAQIQADPVANAANRPVVGVGKNSQGQNVPVVNIQTPVNGVSHNIYKQMDVLSNGVVLNNSRTGAGSAIVGSVGANPFLAKGEARLILNEINSTAATRFEGNLEVAGQRADVVIANPAGINIKGGGFINANKAIFTTGKAQLNADGSLKQFVVDQGKVTVTANTGSTLGLGGNNNNVDYVDIYARALDLNAQLHANQDINVITGANTISADLESIDSKTSTVAAPALAVDIKSLGGMYANNIFLMGNEKGLGVTNAGTVQAVNNIVVTNTGKIVHSGTISTTDKKNGLVSVAGTGAAADIAISGSVNSYGLINIDSDNDVNLNAKDITLNYDATTLNSAALIIGAQGNLNLATGTKINNLSTNGDLYVDAKGISLAANSELRSNRGSANINANESLVSNSTARLIAAKDLNLTANKDLKLIGNTLQATSGSINVQSAEEAHLLQVDGGTLYAGKDLNIYSSGDVSLKNLSFNLVNNATRLKDINIYSGKNLTWDNKAKPLAKISGKLQLEAKQGLELAGTALHAANGIVTQSDTLNLNTTVKSDQGIDLTTHNAMSLAQGTSLTAVKDVNLASLQGSIQAQSLKVNSTAGHASIIAHENVNLNSVQTTVPAPQADRDEQITDKTVINAAQGIVIASAEKGTVSVNSADLTTVKGDLKILGQNGVNLDSNIDVVVGGGDNGYDTTLSNQLEGQSVSVGTKKGNIDIKNTVLTSTVNQLHLNSEAGMLSVADSKLQSKGNTGIYAKDILALKNITANSDQHLAVNSKRTLYLNADYTPTATVWHPSAKTNLTAKGVLSLTATGNQVMQNAQLTGGAILLETTNLFMKPGLVFNATGSDLLKNDSKLSSLNGDLSIQTTGTTGLTIDPKIINLSAIGDIELIAKNGHLKLAGYGGMKGNGSEQIVNLVTSNGGINLIGKSIQLDGSNLNAKGAINLVATNGDIVVDGIKNKHVNAPHTLNYQMLSNEKKNNDQFIAAAKALLVSQYPTDQILLAILGPQYVLNEIAIAEERGKAIQSDMNFYLSNINGFEHKKANVVSNTGNIEINAKQGILLRATDVTSPEKILIESQGTLQKTKTSKELTEQLDAGILIDGVVDSFDFGVDTGANYQVRENFVANQIRGSNGVTINSLGENLTDNLVIQGADIISWYGDVDLQSGKDIQLLTGQDQSYDKSTQTTTKKTWYGKKKTTQTIYQAQNYSSIPVNLQGKNILLKSKGDTVLYSTNMDAYGDIDIKAKNIKLLVTDEIKRKETTSRKKSSFWGFKYNDSTSNSSYKEITQLPVKAKADYISTKAAFDTLLQGSEFNYLSGASITAGGTITLTSATTLIENTLHKEKNSVVWQSMQDTGSITETAKLPSFNGPVVPKFEAKGGLTVQVPVVSGQNNDVRAEVIKLSNQPGNEYLKGLIARKDVNWEAVKLAQENWNYKQQGLTGAGAAIIAIVVVAATAGAGATAVGALGGTASTLGGSAVAMSQAAITTLATQASVSLINNGGDIAKTLNELGSKESVRGLATSIVTAGLLSQVSTALNLKPDSTYFPDRLMNNFATSVGSTLVQTAIKGGNLEDNLQAALLAGLAGALQGELASQIGTSLDKVDPSAFEYTIHKIAHAAVGCAAAAATKASCEAGAIGAGVGEIVAGLMPDPANGIEYTDNEKLKIRNIGKLVSGTVAAYAGYDVNTAANSADTAIQNNSLVKLATATGKVLVKTLDEFNAAKKKGLQYTKSDLVKSLKEQSADELIGIADDLLTVFGRSTSPFDRALAAIDLIVGTDLKPGKGDSLNLAKNELDKLKTDRSYVQTVYQNKVDVITRNRLNGREFEVSAASKLGIQRNSNREMITVRTERDGQINIIPDAFGNGGTLVEFKNLKYITDTKQFRGYAATKKPVTLVINPDTKYSSTIEQTIRESKGAIYTFDQKTQALKLLKDFS